MGTFHKYQVRVFGILTSFHRHIYQVPVFGILTSLHIHISQVQKNLANHQHTKLKSAYSRQKLNRLVARLDARWMLLRTALRISRQKKKCVLLRERKQDVSGSRNKTFVQPHIGDTGLYTVYEIKTK